MRKKPPGGKNISTGVSLPPDLYEWVMERANKPSPDPESTRSASLIIRRALELYRERIEREESPDGPGKSKITARNQAEREKGNAGAEIINPSVSSGTLSSTVGKARCRKAG